jgi:hypothetical protein
MSWKSFSALLSAQLIQKRPRARPRLGVFQHLPVAAEVAKHCLAGA